MAISKRLRAAIYRRDRLRCSYCQRTCLLPSETYQSNPLMATLDHVIPQCDGGLDVRANLVTACNECNGLKGKWAAPIYRKPIGDIQSGQSVRNLARQIVAEQTASGIDHRKRRIRTTKLA